jgi:hypothetical protein
MPGVFASMAATLAGTAPTPAERAASRLSRGAAAWRQTGDPELREMAAGLEAFRDRGGDLRALLQLKARSGYSQDLPAVDRSYSTRNGAIRKLAADLGAEKPGETLIQERLAELILAELARPEVCRMIRETAGAKPLPTSTRQIRRILRG